MELPVKLQREYDEFKQASKSMELIDCYPENVREFLHSYMGVMSTGWYRSIHHDRLILPNTQADVFKGIYYSDTAVKPDAPGSKVNYYITAAVNNSASVIMSFSQAEQQYGKEFHNFCVKVRKTLNEDLKFLRFISQKGSRMLEWCRNRQYMSIDKLLAASREETNLSPAVYQLLQQWGTIQTMLPMPSWLIRHYNIGIQNVLVSETEDKAYLTVLSQSQNWIYLRRESNSATTLVSKSAKDIITDLKPYRKHYFCEACLKYLFTFIDAPITEVGDILYIFNCYTQFLNLVYSTKYALNDVFKWGQYDVYYTNTAKGIRISTVKERDNLAQGVFKRTMYYGNTDAVAKGLALCRWIYRGAKTDFISFMGNTNYTKYIVNLSTHDLKIIIPQVAKLMPKYVEAVFFKGDIDFTQMRKWYAAQPICPETAPNEVPTLSRAELLTWARKCNPNTNLNIIANNIAKRVASGKLSAANITDSQLRLLQDAYVKSQNPEAEAQEDTVEAAQDILHAKEILKNKEYIENKLPQFKFNLQVCATVASKESITPKQRPYVVALYVEYMKLGGNKGKNVVMEPSDDILSAPSKDAGKQMSLFGNY